MPKGNKNCLRQKITNKKSHCKYRLMVLLVHREKEKRKKIRLHVIPGVLAALHNHQRLPDSQISS